MAIPRSEIKNAIKAAVDAAYEIKDPEEREQAIDVWAGRFADAVCEAIGGTDVTFSLSAPNGAVTGSITLKPPQ